MRSKAARAEPRTPTTVPSGAVVPRLGERTILVQAGETAQFSTSAPQASGAHDRAAEILCILGHDGSAIGARPRHSPGARHPRYSDEWRTQPAREQGRAASAAQFGHRPETGAPNPGMTDRAHGL
jgi:hypothetical protein